MCLQIAKCLLLCYNLILFIAAHLSHLLSDFSSPDWCSVTLSSIWPQRRRHAVWLTWRFFPPVLCTLLVFLGFLLFPGGVCEQQSKRYYLIFFMHVMLRHEFTLFGYNDLLLHLCVSSTLVSHGDMVFHYPPTASYSCLFKPCKRDECRRAVGSLLRGLSSCVDAVIRHWEWVFSLEKKLDQSTLM